VTPPLAARPHLHPSSVPPPLTSQVPLSSAPLQVVPGLHPAPFGALSPPRAARDRPETQRTTPLPHDPRSAQAQRALAVRESSAPETVMSNQTSHVTVVILVILAAALAATAVYFVLPLLT
jgi:hypothetical protein